MPTANIEKSEVTIGKRTLDITALPGVSVSAMISRGLTHYFGSEASSKVIAERKRRDEAGSPMSDDEQASYKESVLDDMFEKLLAGTIGVRAVGVVADPIEKVRNRIAKQEVLTILRANGIAVPKKDAPVVFGDGSTKTLADMIATRLERNGEAIEKEARKILADADKKAKAAKALGEEAGVKSADALGL